MSISTRRQILVILILFEIAIFLCDFTQIILLPDYTIRLLEFSLFGIISLIAIFSLNSECKLRYSISKVRKKNKELEEKIAEVEDENRRIKTAANETNTSPIIIKKMKKDEWKKKHA